MATPEPQERNSLVPLPKSLSDPDWQEAADAIAAFYEAHKPPFPHCGRGSLISDANLIAHLLDAVDGGLTPTQAANTIGITAGTVTEWLAKGQDQPSSAFALFASAVKSAQDRRRRRLLGSIEAAGHKGAQYWTAHAWLLERGFGNDYKLAQDKTGGGVTIQIGIKAEDLKLAIASNSSIQVGIPALSESTPLSLTPADTLDIPVSR